MWPRFGIKVGNSTLCIASVKEDGKIDVIANKQGDRISQACLFWDGGSETECGLTAEQKMGLRPNQGVTNSFQFLIPQEEMTSEKVEAAAEDITCNYDKDNHTFELRMRMTGNDTTPSFRISPFDVHVNFFKAELELAKEFLHNSSNEKPNVVLSIPRYYSAESWLPLTQAAEEAGFHVAQIISETTAAVLAYGIGEKSETVANETSPTKSKYVLSIKCGGLFSHFAVYELTNGLYTLLDSKGPFRIGGKQYTEALAQLVCEEFQKKYKLDPHESRRSMEKIRTTVTKCKHILTTIPSTQIYIDSLMDGIDFNMQLSRARFESIIQPVINNFMQVLNESIDKIFQDRCDVQRIDEIVLLGASTQIPKLQSAISNRWPDAKINSSLAADEVVAIGCARQATFLVDPDGKDLDVTEECICVDSDAFIWHDTNEANAIILFRKGTLVPSVISIDVQSDMAAKAVSDDDNVFHIKVGDVISDVYLTDAVTTEEGVFRIEADISLDNGENGNPQTPVIKLRCL